MFLREFPVDKVYRVLQFNSTYLDGVIVLESYDFIEVFKKIMKF